MNKMGDSLRLLLLLRALPSLPRVGIASCICLYRETGITVDHAVSANDHHPRDTLHRKQGSKLLSQGLLLIWDCAPGHACKIILRARQKSPAKHKAN